MKQGSLIASCPLEILCLDFTTMACRKDGKENVPVMMDVFSNFTVAVMTPNQQVKTVAKALVDKWFYTYGIPSGIRSDKGKSFDNNIIHHLCTIYRVKQSTTTPYNPHNDPKCERFNWTLHDLLKMLPKWQKANWPANLNLLVFAYNAVPNSTTGLQLYQLMFGCKAQTPCDNWLGLNNYDSDESVSKSSWLQEHH